MTDADRIRSLEERQADLERRIAELEKEPRGWPWPVHPITPHPQWPDGSDDARCHVCQNRFADMTHYVCTHDRCPGKVTCTYGGASMAEDQLPRYDGGTSLQ